MAEHKTSIEHIQRYHQRWTLIATDYATEILEAEQTEFPNQVHLAHLHAALERYNTKKFAAEQMLKTLGVDVGW